MRWWIGEKGPVHQICIQEPKAECLQLLYETCTISLALIWYHNCRAKGMYQFWILFWRVSVQDWNSVFGDIGATHVVHGSCTVFCLCVNWHLRPRIGTNYTCVKVRYISCKSLCCNPRESSNQAKATSNGSVFVRLWYEGWNPCTYYLPCTNRTRCTHRCHNMWLCSTGKGLQHTHNINICIHIHTDTLYITVHRVVCRNPSNETQEEEEKVKLKTTH